MRRANGESGFTIVEVLVAILILSLAAMTTFALLSAATRNAQRAKANQVALEFAEQELELLRSMKDEQLALTATPPHENNVLSPDYRVLENKFALTRQPVGDYRILVANNGSLYGTEKKITTGIVSPGPDPFTSGDISGKVYRYIVWHNDEKCEETKCPGKQDYKQIVVIVKVNPVPNQPQETGYAEVQSNFIDPTDTAEDDPKPGPGNKIVTAQQFFLSDTPCSTTGVTTRQETMGDHQLRNTRGSCADGLQYGGTKGAPDALLLGSPPDPTPADPTDPPLYDYSNDLYSEKGLQIVKDSTIGCNFGSSGTTKPEAQTHSWVTDPMAEDFVMTEKATLEVFTRRFPETFYTGTLCVYLFKRSEATTPFKDTRLKNTAGGFEYWKLTPEGNKAWPQEWEGLKLTMPFMESPYTINAKERLGVAITVERNNTGGGAIPIIYDTPRFPSRLEVDTSTPIGGG
ncbi:MAG: prepilin-type N-terminal cleavage/methylation domain-containing protein [Solirubrobacterales bacterium]